METRLNSDYGLGNLIYLTVSDGLSVKRNNAGVNPPYVYFLSPYESKERERSAQVRTHFHALVCFPLRRALSESDGQISHSSSLNNNYFKWNSNYFLNLFDDPASATRVFGLSLIKLYKLTLTPRDS